jgi:hypothetical protein
MNMWKTARFATILVIVALSTSRASAASDADLAKQLANPIASLISVPFQFNYDGDIGPANGDRVYVNIQPVIPVSISEDWNMISRTILPVTWQDDVVPGEDQFGLGDTVQSLFFSPKKPTNGIIWGVGPVMLLPTATDEYLGSEKWGAGPTAVALVQSGPWTFGGLANHIWSFAGDDDRQDVSSTFLQPFVNYTTASATSFFINTESTYNWETKNWAVPINAGVNQLIDVGGQKIQIGGGVRYWVNSAHSGPEGFGARLNVIFLFPKSRERALVSSRHRDHSWQ